MATRKRKAISKKTRELVYNKYNGHCAYCGCGIKMKEMQVDHLLAVRRGGKDDIDNYMPSCRSCNYYKHTYSLEQFRKNIETKLYDNMAKTFNFRLLVKFGMIVKMPEKCVFYFEKVNREEKDNVSASNLIQRTNS